MNRRRTGKTSIAHRVWAVFTTLVVIVLVVLVVLLAGVRLVGFTPYAVLSGSMAPTYPVGSLVYVRSVDPETIEPGDVITFVADQNNTVVTHRVTAVDRVNGSFTTKGDANDTEDGQPVYYVNVLGRVCFAVVGLGYLSSYLGTATGRYVALLVICGLFLLILLPGLRVREVEEDS